MARIDTLGNFLTDVADSIREKTGKTDLITPSEFDTEIESISGGEDISDYFNSTISGIDAAVAYSGLSACIKKVPNNITVQGRILKYAFYACTSLTTIPLLDTSNVTNMEKMFQYCSGLITIPQLNTADVKDFTGMFWGCTALTTIPLLNMASATTLSSMFTTCTSLATLGGFSNLGQAYLTTRPANSAYYTLELAPSTQLTEQSIINVLTNVYDIATKGCNAQKIVLGSTNLARLTSVEGQAALTQATNYGWTIS